MKKLLYLLSVAVLIWSCDKVDEIDLPILDEPIVEEENVPASTLPEVLYAYTSGDEEDSQTRTFVENTKVLWNGGDNIFYCAGNRIGAEYKYEGEDKATKATFKKVGNGRSSEVTAAFPVGVFPYRDYFSAKFNSNEIEDESDDTWTISPDFEKNQNYVPNSFDKDANIMIAVGNGEDNNLSFRSACGYVVVRLYGINVTVNEVLLYADYDWGEPTPRIWGKLFDIEVDCNGNFKYNPGNPENGPMPNQVVLNCIDSKTQQGVRISEDPNNPTEFWFALPPVFLEKGFVLQIKDNYTNTQRVIKESTKSFEIERNKVKRMAAVDATNPARTNYLWYKIPAKIVKFDNFENSEEYFDAKIVEHSWDSSSSSTGDKMYYIKFDKPLTEIKAEAFKNTGVTERAEGNAK